MKSWLLPTKPCLCRFSVPLFALCMTLNLGCWQAVRLYSAALELDGGLASAYNNRALAHLKLSNVADAEADCGYVLRLEPQNVKALLRRGTARYSWHGSRRSVCPRVPAYKLHFPMRRF